MTTISQELEACVTTAVVRLEQSIQKTLSSHQELLQLQQQQVECLTELLNSRRDASLEAHCSIAIDRLTALLDRHQQANYQVYSVLTALKQAKDAPALTIDPQGEVATYLSLTLGELTQRLKIDPPTKLSKAAYSATAWSKLMAESPDPEGYQWQFPAIKRGFVFYHQTQLQVIGTKAVELAPSESLN
jgi:hypothetical protein